MKDIETKERLIGVDANKWGDFIELHELEYVSKDDEKIYMNQQQWNQYFEESCKHLFGL